MFIITNFHTELAEGLKTLGGGGDLIEQILLLIRSIGAPLYPFIPSALQFVNTLFVKAGNECIQNQFLSYNEDLIDRTGKVI